MTFTDLLNARLNQVSPMVSNLIMYHFEAIHRQTEHEVKVQNTEEGV